MRILYISQYFPPEVGATQNRAVEMASHLVQLGHTVTVLTEFPNHPKGIIPAEYRRRWFEITQLNGIRVIRVWVFARPYKNFFTRMGFYLTFMCNAALVGSLAAGGYDLVFATSPPYFVGVTGLWLSWIKRARFVYEVRDLWIRSAVELGELNNPRLVRLAGHLDNWYYRKAAAVIAVTQGIYNELAQKGLQEKLHLIYNGANCDLLYYKGDGKKREMGWQNRFVVMYAGIIGIAQGLDLVCRVAETMKNHPEVLFVFIGEGPEKKNIIELKKSLDLQNLALVDEIPREQIADYLSAADCCLVPLKKKEIFRGALPSKLFDAMACERPILLSVDGEARTVIEQTGAGLFVEPENGEQLKQAILNLKGDPEKTGQMGKAGRRFVESNFSRRSAAVQLEQVLIGVINP